MGTDVERVEEVRDCRRCGGPGLMACSVPVDREDGAEQAAEGGARLYVLCERCDIDDPVAGALVAFLTVHVPVSPDGAEALAGYVNAWLESLRPRRDQHVLDAEWEAYKRGDFAEDGGPE